MEKKPFFPLPFSVPAAIFLRVNPSCRKTIWSASRLMIQRKGKRKRERERRGEEKSGMFHILEAFCNLRVYGRAIQPFPSHLATKRKPLSKLAKEKNFFQLPLWCMQLQAPLLAFWVKEPPFFFSGLNPTCCFPPAVNQTAFRGAIRRSERAAEKRGAPFLSRFFGGQGAQFSFGQPPFSYRPRDAATMRRRKRRKKLCL